MEVGLAVFDFGEIDMVVFGADDVDFVEESLMVAGDDGVAVSFEIISDESFGFLADVGGVLLGFDCWCEAGKGFAWFERFAVLWGEAVFIDSIDVSLGAVADMLVESVFGVFFGEINHIVIAGDFGDNGSGRDFANLIVAFDTSGGVFF